MQCNAIFVNTNMVLLFSSRHCFSFFFYLLFLFIWMICLSASLRCFLIMIYSQAHCVLLDSWNKKEAYREVACLIKTRENCHKNKHKLMLPECANGFNGYFLSVSPVVVLQYMYLKTVWEWWLFMIHSDSHNKAILCAKYKPQPFLPRYFIKWW